MSVETLATRREPIQHNSKNKDSNVVVVVVILEWDMSCREGFQVSSLPRRIARSP